MFWNRANHLKQVQGTYKLFKCLSIGEASCINSKTSVSVNPCNASGAFGVFDANQKRNYAYPSKLPFQWVADAKPPALSPEGSGDFDGLPEVDFKNPKLYFDSSKELETAPEEVKKIFSLEFASMAERREKFRSELLKRVQSHPLDRTSPEAKVANMTFVIRNLQRHLQIFPNSPKIKSILSTTIQKRRKTLKKLRHVDYGRFAWLLNELNISYTPHPDEPNQITRKGELQRIANEYCEKMKHDRLAAYSRELKDQQKEFLEEKRQVLEWIEKEEKDLGIKEN